MPKAEAMALITDATTPTAQLQVFKSGATTGLTHGLMTGFTSAPFTRQTMARSSTSRSSISALIRPLARTSASRAISGSIWVHRATGRPVALHHSGGDNPDRATASFIEDVFAAMGVTM